MQQDRGLGRAFYIPALDGWRAIAVGLVIGAHCVPALINSGWKVGKYAAAGFERGGVGVDIFFCLSGYLISTILLREKERTKTIDFASFYIRRVFRIVPPVLLYLGVIFALRTLHFLPPSKTNDIIASLLFYRNYSSGGDWYTGHFWSLAIEEQFYLVAPLFLLLLPVRKAIVASLTLILICVATRYLEYREDWFTDTLLLRTENRYDGLLWGVMLGLLMSHQATTVLLRKYLSVLAVTSVLLASIAIVLCVPSQATHRTVVAFLMPWLIGFSIIRKDSTLTRTLQLKPLRIVGTISYSLYIWQMLFLTPDYVPRALGVLQSQPLALALSLLCAGFSYLVIERPFILIGRAIVRPRQKSKPANYHLILDPRPRLSK
jgi:peptidoglycan/LPS O-acetylase OafA/YrhL